jgi:hypothetical protein
VLGIESVGDVIVAWADVLDQEITYAVLRASGGGGGGGRESNPPTT